MTRQLDELCSRLVEYDTPSLCNALERLNLRPRNVGFTDSSISNVSQTGRVAGIAVTARLESRDQGDNSVPMSTLYAAVAATEGPAIVVVQDDDQPPGCGALLGEVVGTLLKTIGCVGFVTNGCIRDIDEVEALGISAYARGLCVSHAYVRLTAVGIPVDIAGLRIEPGDQLHGDKHGLLSIPKEAALELPRLADAVRAEELTTINWAQSPKFSVPALLARRPPQH